MIANASNSLEFSLRKILSPAFSLEASAIVEPGITVLFGASGSGKTALLKCVAGLLQPDQGRIAIGGQALFDSQAGANENVTSRRIGLVFQNLALFPHLNAEANIAYGMSGLSAAARAARAHAIASAFRIEHALGRRPAQLSGGEQQRVALARTLVTEPRALLLDEPLSALDPGTKAKIMDDLRAWIVEREIPVLYVTHSREEVFAMAERVIALENGRVIAEGTPREVLAGPRHHSIAEWSALENVFDGAIVYTHETEGTMTFRTAQLDLEVPLGRQKTGERARVGISAHDVLLATQPPQGLSARNIVPGRVAGIRQRDAAVSVTVDCQGTTVTAYVTPAAVVSLALQPGREVWVVIKTHSCFLLTQ